MRTVAKAVSSTTIRVVVFILMAVFQDLLQEPTVGLDTLKPPQSRFMIYGQGKVVWYIYPLKCESGNSGQESAVSGIRSSINMASYVRSQLVRSANSMSRGGARGWGWYHRSLEKMNAPAAAVVPYDSAVPAPSQPRPKAFLDVSIGGAPAERITVELAKDVVPKTVENFVKLCNEGFQSTLGSGSYKDSKVHNITKGVYIVAGDILAGNGTGGHAALESGKRYFDDENYALQFTEEGVIGMANAGVNKNASQFFISLQALPHLNGRNVAFGKVVDGKNVLKNIESVYCVQGKPVTDVKITDCGLL